MNDPTSTDVAVLATLATWLRLGSGCESLPMASREALSELADALDPTDFDLRAGVA